MVSDLRKLLAAEFVSEVDTDLVSYSASEDVISMDLDTDQNIVTGTEDVAITEEVVEHYV